MPEGPPGGSKLSPIIIGLIVAALAIVGYIIYEQNREPKTLGEAIDRAADDLKDAADEIGNN